jgi:hypothetical protein
VRSDLRERLEVVLVLSATVLLAVVLAARFHERRGPWLALPETLVDHAGPHQPESRSVLIMIERARQIIPRGKHVTCFIPVDGKAPDDNGPYLSAVGLLPDHVVFPPYTASETSNPPVEYVIAARGRFDHRAYTMVASFAEGAIYRAPR